MVHKNEQYVTPLIRNWNEKGYNRKVPTEQNKFLISHSVKGYKKLNYFQATKNLLQEKFQDKEFY